MPLPSPMSRRRLLAFGLATAALPLLPRLGAAQERLRPTPACDDADPTPPQTEGPFYIPRSPRRASLIEPGVEGERFVLEGRMVDTACRPVPDAVVDLWHADAGGDYDLDGYRLRGHQFTDAQGRFRFETIVPGNYGWRTRHYHVKVGPRRGRLLTTQLYFPGEPRNASDGLFDPALLMDLAENGRAGGFLFVLEV